jgi:DNA-binding transcriptional MerR regulator
VFTIGEFSKITGLTAKTLRFYHEQGLLIPTSVDEETGYRHCDRSKIETAHSITHLPFHIEEKAIDPIMVAGIRMKGRMPNALDYIRAQRFEIQVPTREIYHKGPEMIFRGNPKNYLTEIQMLIEGDEKKLY